MKNNILFILSLAIGLWHPHLGIAYDFVAMKTISVNGGPTSSESIVGGPGGASTSSSGQSDLCFQDNQGLMKCGGAAPSQQGCCCKYQTGCRRYCDHNWQSDSMSEEARGCLPGYSSYGPGWELNGVKGGKCIKWITGSWSEEDYNAGKAEHWHNAEAKAWTYGGGCGCSSNEDW